tara:strand:- start:36 stop:263 length:228 start_codon:yes stop_codon:yes gene_type:complete
MTTNMTSIAVVTKLVTKNYLGAVHDAIALCISLTLGLIMQAVNYVMTATTILSPALQMMFTAGLTTMLCLVIIKL